MTLTKVIVNLPDMTVTSLKYLARAEDVTVTEALRRAIHRQQFLDREVAKGNLVLLQAPFDGRTRKLVRQVRFVPRPQMW